MSVVDQLNILLNSGDCPIDGDGKLTASPTDDAVIRFCKSKHPALQCNTSEVNPTWDLTDSTDSCIISDYVAESLNIGGAVINVHRLLGVHEQGKLQDLTGTGTALSSGDHPNFNVHNAFTLEATKWRSSAIGPNVIGSYIGYDFGEEMLSDSRKRYGIETFVKHDISALKIRQGCRAETRATSARVERSSDGIKWYGVAVVALPNCDGAAIVDFPRSVPSRFWRLRVTAFGGSENDAWEIQALQFMDYEYTRVTNIQDKILMENRDRDYDENPVRMKGSYQPIDIQAMQSKYGFGSLYSGDEWIIEISFSSAIGALGRPFVIGDILQLPSESQYTSSLTEVFKYLEISDVAWSTSGFTPGWVPTIQRLIAKPAMASQETQDIFGKLTEDVDDAGLVDIHDASAEKPYRDIHDIGQAIEAAQNTQVPEVGIDFADRGDVPQEYYDKAADEFGDSAFVAKIDRSRLLFGIDAMPPNGEPYTQANEFPSSPSDRDYHRLTYTHIRSGIPARLHRYSTVKAQWMFLEKDGRASRNFDKKIIHNLLDPDTSTVTPPDTK